MVLNVNVLFFQNGTCLYTIFYRQIDLKWFQGDQDALKHPQRPRQARQWRLKQGPVMFIKN